MKFYHEFLTFKNQIFKSRPVLIRRIIREPELVLLIYRIKL